MFGRIKGLSGLDLENAVTQKIAEVGLTEKVMTDTLEEYTDIHRTKKH